MDQEIINIIFGAVMSILGWFARKLWDAVDKLKDDLKDIEVSLPTKYVAKEEWKDSLDKIETLLNRIFEKLDAKADK